MGNNEDVTWNKERSDAWLQQLRDVAARGYKTADFRPLLDKMRDDLSHDIRAAVVWGLTDTEDRATFWWLAQLAGKARVVEALPILEEKYPNLPFHRGLRDYRDDVRNAISDLKAAQRGACRCWGARGWPSGRPEMVIHDQVSDGETWTTDYRVYCADCGKRWKVHEDSNYHYPVYQWRGVGGRGPWKTKRKS